jgi:hypothetical protein
MSIGVTKDYKVKNLHFQKKQERKSFFFVPRKAKARNGSGGGANGTGPATAGVESPGHSTSGTGGRFCVDMRFDASPGS